MSKKKADEQRRLLLKKYDHHYNIRVMAEDARYVCHYCGDFADCLDHVQPISLYELMVGDDTIDFIKVPSCKDCNALLSDGYTETFPERVHLLRLRANRRLKNNPSRYKKTAWTDEQLEELGRNLRGYIDTGLNKATKNHNQRYFNIFNYDPDDCD